MHIKPLSETSVQGKIVALRVDFNVPTSEGRITEDTRIVESIPTLKFCLKNGAKQIHILSHLGRPKGVPNDKDSLEIVTEKLSKLLGEKVEFRTNLKGGNTRIQLHENVRFYPGETKNDPAFIQKLLGLGAEVFINDGFAVSHRAHASVVGLASFLPSYPGFLLQKEIDHLTPFLSGKKIPGLTIVVGGAKIDTKVKVLEHFAVTAENIIVGGALANTFLAAQGHNVGGSFYQEEQLETARKILALAEKNKTTFHCPTDTVCGRAMDSDNTQTLALDGVSGDTKIFDIGPKTIKHYAHIIHESRVIIWNGPLGCFEFEPFEKGTQGMLKAIAAQKSSKTILGGGDTLEALRKFGVSKSAFTHVSTGGGAMLEFLEGKRLPGIESLLTTKV